MTDTTEAKTTAASAMAPESTERVERFKTEIDRLNVVEPVGKRELMLFRVGIALLIIGPVVGAAAYGMSHNTTSALEQRDAITIGLLGIAVTVAGAALFVSYSLSRFLRFWLVRLSLEQRAETDRVVDALGSSNVP